MSAGLIIKNAALTNVNGVYTEYNADDNGQRWLSNDKLCAIHYVKYLLFSNIEFEEGATVTSDLYGNNRQYYRYNRVTDSHEPIVIAVTDEGKLIDDILGNKELHRVDAPTDEPRNLTEIEIALATEGKRIYWIKNLVTGNVTQVEQASLSTVVTRDADDNALFYTTPIYTLCAGTNMNRWIICEVNATETGLVYGTELYYGFAEIPDVKPYDSIAWVIVTNGTTATDPSINIEFWDESGIDVQTDTTTDADGAIRTTTTFTNRTTHEVYTNVEVVREKKVFTPDIKTRYDYVNLAIGKVYRFRFVSEFEKLGWIPGDETQPVNAGIYKVDSIMSYYDMVTGRIDLFVNLYEKCGVSKEVFDDDKKRLADTVIYRLVDPTDASRMFFMPQIFIEGQPDASVLKYNKVILMIDLGIQPSSATVNKLIQTNGTHPAVIAINEIRGMSLMVKQVMEKLYGLKQTETNPLVQMSVYGNIWLTDEKFRDIVSTREAIKKESTVDLNTLFMLEQSNRWYKENTELRARVAAQDELIQQLSKRLGAQ